VPVVALVLAAAVSAGATTTIDFETLTGPSTFSNGSAAQVTIGVATFSGGMILTNTNGLPADESTLYSSGGVTGGCFGCTNPITITFSTRVSNFSIGVLANGSATVSDNLGGTVTKKLTNWDAITYFSLPERGITSVTITGPAEPVASGLLWDFFIDNISFTALPTSNDQCQRAGWQSFGAFKNQGDCVSFVATGGSNEPALDGVAG
jgi:hypothetical protein